jgi:hypothetical protein
LAVGDFGALGSQGTRVKRRRRKLGRLAGDHRDALATWTCHLHPCKCSPSTQQYLGKEKRPNVRSVWIIQEYVQHAYVCPLSGKE